MLQCRHSRMPHVACVIALCLGLLPGSAAAAPTDPSMAFSEMQTVTVEIVQPTPSVSTGGRLELAIEVHLTAPAEYLEVRLRMRRPSGTLVYQKTEVRSAATAGRYTIEYERDLEPLDLPQGRYPIDIRVLATGAEATTASGRLLLVDPSTPVLPVAVVVNASGTPGVTMTGRLAEDAATNARLRDQLAFVTRLAQDRNAPLGLAVPPILLEEFARVAAGYETTMGVVVPPTDESAARAARLIEALQSGVATGTVRLLDVPYALPDLAGLAAVDGEDDLDLHWTRTDEVHTAVLRSPTVPRTAYLGPRLNAEAIASLGSRGVDCVLAPSAAVLSGETTAAAGCYSIDGQTVRVLVPDEAAAAGARAGADEFYDALFDRLDNGPVVVMLTIGSGDANAGVAVQHALDWIDDAPWARAVSVDSLADSPASAEVSLAEVGPGSAPATYWSEIAASRTSALAYLAATGPDDADAAAAVRAVLAAESSLWSEADDVTSRENGRSLAREAHDFVTQQFSLVRLDAKSVTLSASTGDVPLTIINDTGKLLRLTLHATSASTMTPASPVQDINVQPTQNFFTIPVDLGNAIDETLNVEVRAGSLPVATAEVGVRASYIDRLATVLLVIAVLGLLLVFIRRRVKSADAGTIVGGDSRHGRASRSE